MRWAQRAATLSLGSTVVVVIVKLWAAYVSGSISVLAEGLQSLLDVLMSGLALVTLRIAAAPPDRDHPWGHGKAELLASALQMVVVIGTALFISWQAALRISQPREIEVSWGIAAMAYAALANLGMILYLRKVAASTGSAALQGEAEHLRGDTLATAGVLAGLVAYAITGWQRIDPIIAIVFTALGAFFAFRQLLRVLHPLMDGSLPPEEIAKIETALQSHPEVRGFHNVRTRRSGLLRIVSLHVMLDDHLSFVQAHDMAEQVETELSQALGGALVTVHYEPHEAELEHRAREHPEDSAQ